RFDMSGVKFTSPNDLQQLLDNTLGKYEHLYDIPSNPELLPGIRLKDLIVRARAQTGEKVVVLVDEYDAPLLDTVVDDENFQTMRTMLRSFYSPLKESGEHLRFVFLTGITKFSQLSIFSELNNLKIISMDDRYATICGITEDEIRKYLRPEVEALGEKYAVDFEEMMLKLKEKYDGYHFTENCPDIYNPYSLLNCLEEGKLKNYWFSSGTPTHLTEMLSKYRLRPENLEGFEVRAESFDTPTENPETPIPVLYQSGYLTIKSVRGVRFKLGFPNEEVRLGFLHGLFPYYAKLSNDQKEVFLSELTLAFEERRVDDAMQQMRSFFSSIPYDAERQNEAHYKTMFYLIFRLASSFGVRTEERTAAGRSDFVLETDDAVYVFEFKLHGTAEEALRQIDEKGYAIQYENGSKKLYKIGACFDEELRTLQNWIVQE
ncbi:MAG: AAA family ATPase, partial [Cardiobacteriaceae bacterium]|nr:AAA family ATPase [Cardiobacteriaceae bacterium]